MIIVEGGDNVGKSTLIKQLIEQDPSLRIVHRDRYQPEKEETIATSYIKALVPNEGDRWAYSNSIADRMFASECIYGQLFRKGCRMSDGEHMAVRNILNAYSALVVHCDPPNDTIVKSWQEREQLYDKDPIKIADAYRQRMKQIFCTSDIVQYDWTSKNADVMRRTITGVHMAKQNELKRELTWWAGVPYGVGKLKQPKIILIGESPSPNAKTWVPFANGPAGDFLAWTIERVHQHFTHTVRGELYITNAQKGTDHDAAILREELAFLIGDWTIVICLGREAAQMYDYVRPQLLRQPLNHADIPHPMFWRRFHWNKRHQYVKKFINAINPIFGRKRTW